MDLLEELPSLVDRRETPQWLDRLELLEADRALRVGTEAGATLQMKSRAPSSTLQLTHLGEQAEYDGRVAQGPALDSNYEVTTYAFREPGEHEIVWRLGGWSSNALTVTVEP